MSTRREKRSRKATQAFFSATPSSSSVAEPQPDSRITVALAATTPGEKACLIFKLLTTNLEERIRAEDADTNLALGRAKLGKTFAIEGYEEEVAHVEEVEEGLDIAHELKKMIMDIKCTKDEGVEVRLDEGIESAYRNVQLFNREKIFSFFREDTRGIVAQAESWSGRKFEREPKSLRQIFNDPMCLVEEDISKGIQERPKAVNLAVALLDFRRLSKLVSQDLQAFNENFACEEAKLPQIPDIVTYRGCRLPDTVPERIRKSAWDLQFIKEDMMNLREQLLLLRESIREVMVIWLTANSAAWEYGIAHVHEYPKMREYEYLRTSIQASNVLGQREESKVLSYFLSDGSIRGVCPDLQSNLSKEELDKSNKAWDDRQKMLIDIFVSVDEIAKTIRKCNLPKDEEARIASQRK